MIRTFTVMCIMVHGQLFKDTLTPKNIDFSYIIFKLIERDYEVVIMEHRNIYICHIKGY